jgi:hypothetical protein
MIKYVRELVSNLEGIRGTSSYANYSLYLTLSPHQMQFQAGCFFSLNFIMHSLLQKKCSSPEKVAARAFLFGI